MNIKEAHPSKYVSAADLQGKPHVVTMSHVTMEEVGRNKDSKPVLWFNGKAKGMVLNKTNGAFIAEIYGDETNNWKNKQIEIYPDRCLFEGEMKDCLRVRPPARVSPTQAPAYVPPQLNAGNAVAPPERPVNVPPIEDTTDYESYGGEEEDEDVPF